MQRVQCKSVPLNVRRDVGQDHVSDVDEVTEPTDRSSRIDVEGGTSGDVEDVAQFPLRGCFGME